jgi:hypothetical protein
MAQAPPSPNKTDNRNAQANPAPPDERFWKHYSPHGEFPLSSVGSLVIHLLVFGLLILMGWLAVVLFDQSSKSLPVEAVRLDLGGGGGNPRGQGDGPNTGATPQEVGSEANEKSTEKQPEDVPPPELKVDPNPQVKPNLDDPKRQIQETDSKSSKTFSDLRQKAASIQLPGSAPSGHGKGGTGSGGGSGDGTGKGIGSGRGDGVATPTQREKRMLRWTMLFNVDNSPDYVAQLRGLGALLAIPVRENGNQVEYEIVSDLSARPAKLVKRDIKEIQRMVYWVDDKPDSVQAVMSVLGLQLRPSHFLAFMPEALEKKLLNLEITYLHKRHPSRSEDDIASTKFRIKPRGGKYEPEVLEQKLNK